MPSVTAGPFLTLWMAPGAIWMASPVYARDRLPLDAAFEGPATLEQLDCTTAVEPGDKVRKDRIGNLVISVGCAAPTSGRRDVFSPG
jgi:hypothetical protein